MTLKYLLAGAALAATMGLASTANAVVIGTESDSSGFIGSLFGSVFPDVTTYQVASDGESPFLPFGATFDTSDGLDFANVGHTWTQAEDSHWTSLGSQTWVLPASTSCGSENEPHCELVGHFVSPDSWTAKAVGTWYILNSEGGVSDKIVTFNTDGGANVKFYSDPGVPEPATWAMMLIGFFGMGAVVRGRRHAVAN
jgi:hypothetical protein